MNIIDRPGRFYALLILSPGLIFCGINTNKNKYIQLFLILNGLLLFIYELFWISFKNDETIL
jgi:membrane-bound ClpP family serine protease